MPLLLTIDAGNTNIVLGVFEDGVLKAHWRLSTRREQTLDNVGPFATGEDKKEPARPQLDAAAGLASS